MQLVEQHVISKHDQRYSVIDAAAFASKNLYNAALYEMRQAFFNDGIYLTYNQMQRRMQSYEAYKALPAKVSQQILMLLDKNWTSFKEAKKAYERVETVPSQRGSRACHKTNGADHEHTQPPY